MKVIRAEDAKMVAHIPITGRRSRGLMDVQLDSYAFDAIPVEWLKAHKTEYLEDWGEEPVTVETALRLWQQEQEAHNEHV